MPAETAAALAESPEPQEGTMTAQTFTVGPNAYDVRIECDRCHESKAGSLARAWQGSHECADLRAEAETLVREFARAYPTPNVLRGVALCESGRIGWQEFAALCARSYGEAKAEVAR